jgi:hypothetical protein
LIISKDKFNYQLDLKGFSWWNFFGNDCLVYSYLALFLLFHHLVEKYSEDNYVLELILKVISLCKIVASDEKANIYTQKHYVMNIIFNVFENNIIFNEDEAA